MKIILDDGTELPVEQVNYEEARKIVQNYEALIEHAEKAIECQERITEQMREKTRELRNLYDAWSAIKDAVWRHNNLISTLKGSEND